MGNKVAATFRASLSCHGAVTEGSPPGQGGCRLEVGFRRLSVQRVFESD